MVTTGNGNRRDPDDGNDWINTHGNSIVLGGAGDDVIEITGDNTTVSFRQGDGHDVVKSYEGATVAIIGYTNDDMLLTRGHGSAMVTFEGSDDSLLLDVSNWTAATLTFADGSSLSAEA